ncbi:MAG: amidohydrolase family protein [Planctomycetaceae bacterium]|nr:amidohydrolase family protein [Planctomycetaceae bacterium]MCA9043881.1 amidohydrolase family protein [Planctomycetaceae bacterium]MCB9953536.1 amidohydrolase family protein [Planctomycetaceae bacterium]
MRSVYRASWLYCGDGPPLAEGYVVVELGRIVEVGQGTFSGEADEVTNLTGYALLPQLVNVHTHLEFSLLEKPIEPRDRFADWIQSVVKWRRQSGGDVLEAVQAGLKESFASGVGTIGEIATSDWHRDFEGFGQAETPGIVVFRELLGLNPDAIETQLEVARKHLADRPAEGVRLGLSPHAPYSVHPELFHRLVDYVAAIPQQPVVAMHLAESPAELQLLRSGDGPLADMLKDFGVWQEGVFQRETRPLDYLNQLARLDRSIVVHGNYLDEVALQFLADHEQMSVAYCPRTHAAMGHPTHPWREMLRRGINVALGTDSRASNPDLSVWEELRLLATLAPDMAASELLKLATVNGARALGLEPGTASITAGHPAHVLVVPLSSVAIADPEATLFKTPLVAGCMRKLG